MTGDGGIGPVAPEETTGRRVGPAADRGAHTDAIGTAGGYGANQAGGAVPAVGAGGQPVARGATIDAESGSLSRAGAHAVTAGTTWPERDARLPCARVTSAGSLGADTCGTLMAKIP